MLSRLVLTLLLFLGIVEPEGSDAFLFGTSPRRVSLKSESNGSGCFLRRLRMGSYDYEEGEDDNDDEDEIDLDALGDWRAFRMSLTESGIRTPEEMSGLPTISEGSSSDSEKERLKEKQSSRGKKQTRKSVSKLNEQLLESQNEQLAKEYVEGVWAHEVPAPEVGGLVCRLPLEAEIYRTNRRTRIGKSLQKILNLDKNEDGWSSYRKQRPSSSSFYNDSLDEGTESEEAESRSPPGISFSPLAAKTVLWYRQASSLIEAQMKRITDSAEDGQIDASKLDPESIELLQLYLDNQETWQEVCLVLDQDENDGTAMTVVINRPMALKLTENLAGLVLYGAFASENVTPSRTQELVRFLVAFENECAVYVGGPDDQDKPALLVHGIKDLPGAVEVSPGMNIYTGGLEAAVDGVLAGKYKPLDFRFFVGRHKYGERELEAKIHVGKYQPIACARCLVLKQCISLPKPLWHEVLELCGGELKEISSLELMKRDDIQFEELDEE